MNFKLAKLLTIPRMGAGMLFRWVAKHIYLFIFLIVVFPIIIGSFQTAIETKNVFFDEDTPFLDKIYIILKSNNYVLTKDSINAN